MTGTSTLDPLAHPSRDVLRCSSQSDPRGRTLRLPGPGSCLWPAVLFRPIHPFHIVARQFGQGNCLIPGVVAELDYCVLVRGAAAVPLVMGVIVAPGAEKKLTPCGVVLDCSGDGFGVTIRAEKLLFRPYLLYLPILLGPRRPELAPPPSCWGVGCCARGVSSPVSGFRGGLEWTPALSNLPSGGEGQSYRPKDTRATINRIVGQMKSRKDGEGYEL